MESNLRQKISGSNFDYIFLIHRLWTEGKRKRGGIDKVMDYLIQKNKRILLIEHPLEGLAEEPALENYQTIISQVSRSGIQEIYKKNLRKGNSILSWIYEVWFNSMILRLLKREVNIVSSDPLNNLTVIINSNRLGKKYFHCVDFSDARFSNPILNLIYKKIQLMSFKSFDTIGVVSIKTKKRLVELGCDADKLFYIPNSPPFVKMENLVKKPYSILYMSRGVMEKYKIDYAIEILRLIKIKYPEVVLYLAGGMDQDKKYVRKINDMVKKYKLKSNVKFLGYIVDEEYYEYLKKCQIAFCFNSDSVKFHTQYGDSLKIRECALYGIPTIADDSTCTAYEMVEYDAGKIIYSAKQAALETCRLFEHKDQYKQLSQNAIMWAQAKDKKLILNKLYKKIN